MVAKISMAGRRNFYDTAWLVETDAGSVIVVREDDETEDSIRKLVETAQSLSDITALDLRNRIFYD